jgi:hypothetical protein
MSDPEVLLRETFRRAETDAPQDRDLARVARGLARRRRRTRVGATAGLAAIAAVAVGVAAMQAPERVGEVATAPATPTASATGVLGKSRIVSAYGLEVTVPAGWPTNDVRCGQPTGSTVVFDSRPIDFCLPPPEPATVEVVAVGRVGRLLGVDVGPDPPRLEWEDIQVDGEPARRAFAKRADGRTAAALVFPQRGVGVWLRVHDAALAQAVVASVRAVSGDVDRNGCFFTLQPGGRLENPAPAPIDVGAPEWAAACHYDSGRLIVSDRREGAQLESLLDLLRRAPAGPNPDASPADCPREDNAAAGVAPPPLVFVLHADGEPDRRLAVYHSTCVRRGIEHPGGVAHVTVRVISAGGGGMGVGDKWHPAGIPKG